MSKFCSFWGFRVVNAVNDAITFVLASPSLLPFRGNKFMGLYTVKKKICVREMTVEVGSFSGCPGCYLGNIRVFPTIDMMQLVPFYWVCC